MRFLIALISSLTLKIHTYTHTLVCICSILWLEFEPLIFDITFMTRDQPAEMSFVDNKFSILFDKHVNLLK